LTKRIVSGVLLALSLLSLLTLAFSIQSVKGEGAIHVRADGRVGLFTPSLVSSEDVGSISAGIYDVTGRPRDVFSSGENIRIVAESSSKSIRIVVKDQDGIVVLNETYKRAILGSSNGEASQTFYLCDGPVFSVNIWVLEQSIYDVGKDAAEVMDAGVWVKWQRVENFSQSVEGDRHFVVQTGPYGKTTVEFGDGLKGAVPPAGDGNIKAAYSVDAQGQGTVVAGEVENLLTSIVYNKTISGLTGKSGQYTMEASSPVDGSCVRVYFTVFSWNYVFEDTDGRGTILKINIVLKFFEFIRPGMDYGIRKATFMQSCGRAIIINHNDKQLRLITVAVDTKLDFCIANAWDPQTRKCYLLIDKPGIEK